MNYLDELQDKIKTFNNGTFPKVLVGAPNNVRKDYILERYINRLKELSYQNYEIVLADNSKDDTYKSKIEGFGIKCLKTAWYEGSRARIVESRNAIRQYMLDNNFDYYLSIEADVIPPRDIIEQLLQHNKEIVGGWYYVCDPGKARPCIGSTWTLVDGDKLINNPPVGNQMGMYRLIKVFLGSMGIMLFKRNVMEKIKFQVYEHFSQHDDTWFFFAAENHGFDVYVDTDLLVAHFQSTGQWEGETR